MNDPMFTPLKVECKSLVLGPPTVRGGCLQCCWEISLGLEVLEKVSWFYRPFLSPLPRTDRTISGWFIIRTDYASCPLVFMQSFTMTYLPRLMRLTLIWAKIFWEFLHIYAMCFSCLSFSSHWNRMLICVRVWEREREGGMCLILFKL